MKEINHISTKIKLISREPFITCKLIKIIIILLLIGCLIEYNYYSLIYGKNNFKKEVYLKIYIMTHKDFKNYRYNPVYSIVADDKTQLKEKYNLSIIYANEGKLYKKKRAYSEMSKLFYIYELYKNGCNSSKYIGLNHYRRYFNFTDNIPDLDIIFKNYDVILNSPRIVNGSMKTQFCKYHNCKKYEEIIDIIRDIKPEYYETSLQINNESKIYICNLFIMKKKDFLEYCEFMFDVLFEFDRRNNYSSDEELLQYSKKIYKDLNSQLYQSRLEAFLSERIGNIFYHKHFKKIKIFDFGNYGNAEKII